MAEKDLQKKVSELEAQVRTLKKNNLGLVFEDKAEDVVEQSKTQVPVLKEVVKNRIDLDEAYPNNLMIEGDNYLALSVLNYTHKKSIDLIYIDPPYNTGNRDFIYNDQYVDKEDGYRHSKWLSFMRNRLEIARELLADDGVIFISIDDNEQAHLRILCDKVFGEDNFITTFIWEKTQHFGRQKLNFYSNSEYVICYAKNLFSRDGLKELLIEYEKSEFEDAPLYNASNPENVLEFPVGSVKFNIQDGEYTKTTDEKYELINAVVVKNGKNKNAFKLKFRSRWSAKKALEEVAKGTTYWVKSENFAIRAIYADGKTFFESPKQLIFTNQKNEFVTKDKNGTKVGTNEEASAELKELGVVGFDYPKPTSLIGYLISLTKANTILDFFAGSGTTGHAVLKLNAEDGGNRRFILCTNNEDNNGSGKKIATDICYPRVKKVIKGYGDTAGLPSNLFYYKTDLVDIEQIHRVPDDKKISITYEAGEMIAVREDTLDEVEKNDWWQIFEGIGKLTAIYFKEDKAKLAELIAKLEKKNLPTALYIFSWGKNEYKGEYSTANIRVEDIPEPIIEVYKELNRL